MSACGKKVPVLYSLLELDNIYVNKKQIRESYLRLAKKYHPDKNTANVVKQNNFLHIVQAYSILYDDKKREKYDSKYQNN